MKKLYKLVIALSILLVYSATTIAQTSLYSFESSTNGANVSGVSFSNSGTPAGTFVYAANPSSSGINTSTKVATYTAGTTPSANGSYVYAFISGSDVGANVLSTINAIPNAVIKAKIYIPSGSSITAVNMYYKVNGISLTSNLMTTGLTGSWQTIVIGPVPVNGTGSELGFYFTGLSTGSTISFDDITVEPLANANAAPTSLADFASGTYNLATNFGGFTVGGVAGNGKYNYKCC